MSEHENMREGKRKQTVGVEDAIGHKDSACLLEKLEDSNGRGGDVGAGTHVAHVLPLQTRISRRVT